MKTSIALAFVLALVTPAVEGQTFAKGEMLFDHGLSLEAQKELIDVVFSSNAADKPKALNLLASIAIDKNNLKAGLDAWNKLIKDFPASSEAIAAKQRMPLLASVLEQVADETINDAAARVYLRNADFWSKERDRIFKIDSSWIPNVEAAVFWYDKVILEIPNSPAARIAYEEKMQTLLGWKESGQYGEAHGVRGNATVYLPILESTFRQYEKEFPTASASQAVRFQIAQAHWRNKNWAKCKEWLNEIVAKDGNANSFYKDLAERRLKKVEY